jgi:hypothetical protein
MKPSLYEVQIKECKFSQQLLIGWKEISIWQNIDRFKTYNFYLKHFSTRVLKEWQGKVNLPLCLIKTSRHEVICGTGGIVPRILYLDTRRRCDTGHIICDWYGNVSQQQMNIGASDIYKMAKNGLLYVSYAYEGVSESFRTEPIMKYTLTTINARWEAAQRVGAAKLTRLTHRITTQLHLVAETWTVCSSGSRRPVRNFWIRPHTLKCNSSWLPTIKLHQKCSLFVLCLVMFFKFINRSFMRYLLTISNLPSIRLSIPIHYSWLSPWNQETVRVSSLLFFTRYFFPSLLNIYLHKIFHDPVYIKICYGIYQFCMGVKLGFTHQVTVFKSLYIGVHSANISSRYLLNFMCVCVCVCVCKRAFQIFFIFKINTL